MLTPLFRALLLLVVTLAVGAAEAIPKAVAPLRPPLLADEEGKPVDGIGLAHVDLQAVVHGTLAQATLTVTLANDQPRVLGGNLVFPLPDGATVTGYGLDINGVMVDGVAVEKERARMIYETEIHKRVDPGLVEHVAGNQFRTRVYPIPAKGARTVRVEYVTEIQQGAEGAGLALPLAFDGVIDELSMQIQAPEATAAPTVKAGAVEGLNFKPAERGFAASASAKNVRAADELRIALPQFPQRSTAIEKRPRLARTIEELQSHEAVAPEGFSGFEHYFIINDTPHAAERQPVQLKNRRVGIVWDASLSRGDADHAHELAVLSAALDRLGHPAADLIVVRNDIEIRRDFAGGAAGSAALIDAVKALPYDGATNLGALTFPRNANDYAGQNGHAPVPDYDLFLFFTDGYGNLGREMPLRAEVPVYALTDSPSTNYPLLRQLSQESGGALVDLRRVGDEQALATLGDAPFALIGVECDPNQVADVYPLPGTPITGRLTATGRLLAPEATVTLKYGHGREVTATATFTLHAADATVGTLLPRYWAQQKVAALSSFPEQNADELNRLGKRFNLVTPNTSLLVLETVDQYVQYRVVPPTSRPEVYKEFLAKIEQQQTQEARTREEKLSQVVAMWNARVEWWDRKFDYPKGLKVRDDGMDKNAAAGGLTPGVAAPAPGQVAADAALLPTDAPPAALPPDAPLARAGASRDPSAMTGRPRTPALQPEAEHGRSPAYGEAEARRELRADDSRDGSAVAGHLAVSNASAHGGEQPEGLASLDRGEARAGRVARQHAETPSALSDETLKQSLVESRGDADALQVTIKPWDPNTPYIAAMKAVAPDKAYGVYLAQRRENLRSPAFYFDCADYLLSVGQRQLAIRVLSDIVELQLQDARLLRVAAHRFNQIGEREMTIDLFEKVLRLRPEEPQSYRDLALALADRAEAATRDQLEVAPKAAVMSSALADYQRSLELLNKVVLGNWGPRFPEVELPVLMEANDILAKAHRLAGGQAILCPIDSRLLKNLDLDVRVVMTWDADQTDIDLWVTEPSGEKCFYAHNRTIIGGLLSHDFTDGYGPEEYCLRRCMSGKYLVQANFYGSRQQELTGPATVQATVITHFGRPDEKRQALTIRLKDVKQVIDLGTITE